jgi:SH3-like domain-containing protein
MRVVSHLRFRPHKVALLLLAFLLLSSLPSFAAQYVSVKNDGVNVRSGPNTNKEILWEVFKGFPMEVVDKKGDWSEVVDFEGDKGWVYSPLLSNTHTVIVKVNTANMRVGPGKSYEVIATVKYGVVFQPIDSDGEWIKVKHEDGTTGWIHKNLLWPVGS